MQNKVRYISIYLGYEGEAEWGDEELGHGHEEVVEDEYPPAGFGDGDAGGFKGAVFGAGGVAFADGEECEEEVGDACEAHADGDFAGCGDFFAFLGE